MCASDGVDCRSLSTESNSLLSIVVALDAGDSSKSGGGNGGGEILLLPSG